MFPHVLLLGFTHQSDWHDDLSQSLLGLGFSDISLIDGVKWNDLPESPPWQFGSLGSVYPYRGWCDPYTRRAQTIGDVARILTHILAWHRVIELDRPALILEGGAILVEDLADQIPDVLTDLSHIDYSLCYFDSRVSSVFLHRHRGWICPLAGRLIHSVNYCPASTLAYMISPSGARTLLSSPWQKHLVPVDVYIPASFALYDDSQVNHIFSGLASEVSVKSNILHAPMNRFFVSSDISLATASEARGHIVSTFQSFFTSGTDVVHLNGAVKGPGILESQGSFLALVISFEGTEDLDRLRRSARCYGFSFDALGLDNTESVTDGLKIEALRSRLADVPSDTVILLSDAAGVLVNGYVNDILGCWRMLGSKIVFAASRVCLLDESYVEMYPSCDTPYRFLDSALFMGRADDIRSLLAYEIADGDNLQRHFTVLFLGADNGNGADKIILDHRCRLFQSLNGCLDDVSVDAVHGRLFNKVTRSWPCLVHAGVSDARDWLDNEGKALEGWG